MTERYSFSLTTFSPSGKLVQIEYALSAVAAGAASVAIKAKDGVVLAAENKTSCLVGGNYIRKIEQISDHVAMTYSDLGPDFSGVRPFGVSLLVGAWDTEEGRPYLFQCDPSGAAYPWKATALGRNYINSRTFLEKRYNEDLELDDAIHTALLTLKESFDIEMNEANVQVGVCKKAGFQFLPKQTIKDHISVL